MRSIPKRIHAAHVMALLVSVLVLSPVAPARAASPGAGDVWTASANLYTLSDGRWHATRSVDSLTLLRGVLTVRGSGAGRFARTATMTLQHMSWQGFTRTYTRPMIAVSMRLRRGSHDRAVFVGTVRIPTAFPVYWAVARFTARDGGGVVREEAGVMVGGPFPQTRANTLTVDRAHAFCQSRPGRVPNLRYAIYLHGYFVPVESLGRGPPLGVYLDRRHRAPMAEPIPLRLQAHAVLGDGFGQPVRAGWATRAGFLNCDGRQGPGLNAEL